MSDVKVVSSVISSLHKKEGYVPHVRHVYNVLVGNNKPSRSQYSSPEFKKVKRDYDKAIFRMMEKIND